MKVWRVEHGEHQDQEQRPYGPYRTYGNLPTEGLADMYGAHCGGVHATPYGDPKLMGISFGELCALESRTALDAWFDGWHEVLDSLGYVISVYEVPARSVRKGSNGQVVFTYTDAKRLANEFWGVMA